jgi:hypothetical protein
MPKNEVSNLITEQVLDQETERQRRKELRREQVREQVLDRLWEIAKMSPEMTRSSITGQVKALSMIVAIEGLIPDRRAGSAEKNSAPPLPEVDIYPAAWLGRQQEKSIDPRPDTAFAQEEDEPGLNEPETPRHSAGDPPPPSAPTPNPIQNPSESAFARRFSSSETTSTPPHAPSFVPDTRVPFSIKRNLFGPRR